eukprot:scpid101218/ scgid32716/ 
MPDCNATAWFLLVQICKQLLKLAETFAAKKVQVTPGIACDTAKVEPIPTSTISQLRQLCAWRTECDLGITWFLAPCIVASQNGFCMSRLTCPKCCVQFANG